MFDFLRNRNRNQYKNKEKKRNPIVAGSIAGATGYIGTLPLDFVKQRLQSAATTTLAGRSITASSGSKLIMQTIRENGVKTLFKGGLIGSMSIVPQMAIKFSVNDYLSSRSSSSRSSSSSSSSNNWDKYKNGFIAGYVDGSFLGPVLAVQSLLQMNQKNLTNYHEAFQCLKKVPIVPFTLPLAMRNAVYTSVIFGGQASYLNYYNKKEQTFIGNFVSSSIMNIPGVIACSPFDVIRAKQIQYIIDKKTVNPFSVAKDIYAARGVRGFYQGFSSLYVNFAIRFPITFSLYFLLMNQ